MVGGGRNNEATAEIRRTAARDARARGDAAAVHRYSSQSGKLGTKKKKNQERLKCSMKMTYHWSTGYEEIILDVGGASLAV